MNANPQIDKLKEDFAKLKEAMTRERKSGHDVFIASIKLAALPSKIKMAEATKTGRDIYIAQKIIEAVMKELADTKIQPEENFKSIQEIFQKIQNDIDRTKQALSLGKKEEALKLYVGITEKYSSLNYEQKMLLWPQCKKVFTSIAALKK